MKRFRVNNLTVAVDRAAAGGLQACGAVHSCPVGPASVGCAITFDCPGNSILCRDNTLVGCGRATINCDFFTNNCLLTGNCGFATGGCGLNFSTLRPTDLTDVIRTMDPVDRGNLIAEMKVDLAAAIEQLEVAEKETAVLTQPQSLEEVNELEGNLRKALDEVKAMKKKFG